MKTIFIQYFQIYNEIAAIHEDLKKLQLQNQVRKNLICGYDRPVLESLMALYIRRTNPFIENAELSLKTEKLIEKLVSDMANGNTAVD